MRMGGCYLVARARLLWASLIGVLGVGVGAAAFTFGEPIALAIPIPTFLAATLAARKLQNLRNGRLGERLVIQLLRELPDDYHLVNDVVLPSRRGNVDHVLIGPCGVLVIETKRWAGQIRCLRDNWYVGRIPRPSASRQAKAGATSLGLLSAT